MKYRSNSILAHIPQNKAGERILKQIIVFQNALGMRVFLMDIIKSKSLFTPNPKSKRNQIRHQGELNKFIEFVKRTLEKEIPDNIILRIGWGNIVRTLISESEHGGHEFVILDKSIENNAESLSKADVDRFVSKSHCPILTIDKSYLVKDVNKIIVPIDISQRTKKRLYWATFFAKKFKAKVIIVSALNINIETTKSLAFKNAENLKKMLQHRGIECEVKILKLQQQELHVAVLEYIEKENPDLVIIRTHQEIRFSGRKIGKFVSKIIHGCKMPVFSVGGATQNYDIDSIK